MGGPRLSALHVLHALCVLLILLEDGPQSTRASACPPKCPPDSSCVGGTACRCNPGFQSSSGEINVNPGETCEDINECEQGRPGTACGRSADCHNTKGGYYCTCSPGYSPGSGATKFSNASENTCKDVNECTWGQNPCHKTTHCLNKVGSYECHCRPGWKPVPGSPNGPNNTVCEDVDECSSGQHSCHNSTECRNTKGSYECRCRPGWKPVPGSPNGPNNTVCEDVNECTWEQNPCHKTTQCLNKVGSYECRCRPGWKLVPGSPNGPNNTVCEDVDECSSGQHSCHNSTECHNTEGSYECRCRSGWKPVPASPNGPDNTGCEDVNECTWGQNPCHKTTQCLNKVGSYECHCRPGWKPVPGSPNGPNNTVCEEISFPTWTPPPGIKSQSISNFFEKVQELSRDFKSASAQDTIKKFIDSLKELEAPGDLEDLALPDRYRMATHLLSYLEEVLRTLAKTLPARSFTYNPSSDTELSLMIGEQLNETVTLGQTHARMKLNWTQAAGVGDSGPTVAGVFSSRAMQKLLENASMELDTEKKDKLEDAYESSVKVHHSTILSTVNTVFLSNKNTEKLDPPVTFAFSHHPATPSSREELICAFWKGNDSGGYWSTTGCKKLGSRNNSIICECSHLSSFAVLMAHYDVEDVKLALITKVGLALSLVCLLLCILTFLLVRPIQGSRTTVHLHLCICLFLGSAIFLAGIENEGDQVELRCRLVAGLLHYCFLAAFCWMSLEGMELYFLVVRVFQGQGLSKPWLYLIGYGVPFLIVAISAASKPEGYGRKIYCWLNPEHGFLWSFLGPVTFIILCNAVIFMITVWKLTQKFSEINPDMKKLKKARVLTITAIAQLLVLGCTWVFGLFLFNPRSQVLAYAFTILNCLQGFFLFLLHCLLNKKVREEYQKWARMVTGNKYSDFATSTSSSSHNQTRVLRPSESGM
ncbi:adhesion G protein-coupled receptor E5 isoform X2 [Eptesicus fuscus]|uniref:adhesion G protein-coupled receptor E5 isoform X2 n=1 Tax=Eptesicus fuscus TaxID=29078 RepID=UPI0024047FF4|nr:adhesion G protein-coupled receptor E5 isoform X2 [Eptesicus fuscus]